MDGESMIEVDEVWAQYWQAAREHRLIIQWCPACERHQFYPRRHCTYCLGPVEWREASGRGSVYAHTEVHWSALRDFQDETPYLYALVDLDEDVRLTAQIVGPVDGLGCGSAVNVDFIERMGRTLPVFRLAAEETRRTA